MLCIFQSRVIKTLLFAGFYCFKEGVQLRKVYKHFQSIWVGQGGLIVPLFFFGVCVVKGREG